MDERPDDRAVVAAFVDRQKVHKKHHEVSEEQAAGHVQAYQVVLVLQVSAKASVEFSNL